MIREYNNGFLTGFGEPHDETLVFYLCFSKNQITPVKKAQRELVQARVDPLDWPTSGEALPIPLHNHDPRFETQVIGPVLIVLSSDCLYDRPS